jgi:hypothetical protein
VISFALAAPAVVTGCATHRVYDLAYSDYHVWNGQEVVLYQRWEGDTHREHKEFNKRPADEQKLYWTWHHAQANGGHHGK